MPRGQRRNLAPAVMQYDDLPQIEDVGAGDWIRWCLYSYPGWGKTSAWGTAAAGGMRTLIIRSSMDLMPARIMHTGAKQFIADNWEKMYEILDFLRMSNHGYDWVIWDNASVHQDVLLDDVWAGTVAVKPGRAYKIEDGKIVGPNLDPTSGLDKGEYGRNMERIQQWMRHMVGCNSFHFAWGAHPHEGQHPTNDEGGYILRPYIQGRNMTEKLCGYCNIISFMELKEGDDDQKWRRLHFQESPRWYAKDLYDAFPKGYMDITTTTPTIPNLVARIEKARGKSLGVQDTPGPKPTTARGRGRARGRSGSGKAH